MKNKLFLILLLLTCNVSATLHTVAFEHDTIMYNCNLGILNLRVSQSRLFDQEVACILAYDSFTLTGEYREYKKKFEDKSDDFLEVMYIIHDVDNYIISKRGVK
jgi:hypothetical protein